MYSTNTNNQQDRGRQALNVKPAPWGGHYIIHIEDVITDTGKLERCFLPRFTDMERRARRHD